MLAYKLPPSIKEQLWSYSASEVGAKGWLKQELSETHDFMDSLTEAKELALSAKERIHIGRYMNETQQAALWKIVQAFEALNDDLISMYADAAQERLDEVGAELDRRGG